MAYIYLKMFQNVTDCVCVCVCVAEAACYFLIYLYPTKSLKEYRAFETHKI